MTPALAGAASAIRLTLHVLAACVWVGGQLVVAGLLPTIRRLGGDAPRVVARALARLSWPAFAVLVGTGVWNVAAEHAPSAGGAWNAVLDAKIAVVVLAGAAAFVHGRARHRAAIAAFGALAGLASLAAVALGVLLAG